MTTESVNYQCPSCGGNLSFDTGSGLLRCDHCESAFTVREVEAYYARKQAKRDSAAVAASERAEDKGQDSQEQVGSDTPPDALTQGTIEEAVGVSSSQHDPVQRYLSRASWKEEERQGMRSFTCSSCGAELIVDATAVVSKCPYCGNGTIVAGTLAEDARPDYVIPFKIGKEKAVEKLSDFYKDKKLLPKEFTEANHIEHVQGIYVPFWLYDGVGYGRMRAKGWRKQEQTRGRHEEKVIDEYEIWREGDLGFGWVPADGSDKMPDAMMDSIEPYDFSETDRFSMACIPGFMAERFDRGPEECEGRALRRMGKSFEERFRRCADREYSEVEVESIENRVNITGVSQALLPVWMLHTRWEGKDYLFAMNGQTGKMVGDLPVSKPRTAAYFGKCLLISFLIVLVLVLICGGFELGIGGMLSLTLFCSIICAGGASKKAYENMKTARIKEDAADYANGELRVAIKRDDFVSRRVERD